MKLMGTDGGSLVVISVVVGLMVCLHAPPCPNVRGETQVTNVHRAILIRMASLRLLRVSRRRHDTGLWDRTGGLLRFPPVLQRGLEAIEDRNSTTEVAEAMMHCKLGVLRSAEY